MKRITVTLLTLAFFTTQFANAQTCPDKATYTNQSGTFDLTGGTSIVLDGGKVYQISIQNDFSSTSSICVLNGSTLYLSFQNANNMGKGGFINIDKGATLSIGGNGINNFPLTINNNGTTTQSTNVTYTDGATINNTGTYTISADASLNAGTISFTNSGTMNLNASLNYNNGNFTITNAANGNLSFSNTLTLSSTTIRNAGTINCSGPVTLQNASYITNNNMMNLSSDLSFSGATFTNNGVVYISGSTNVNTGSTFNNSCTIKSKGSLSNNGSMSNTGTIILGTSFVNQGKFSNGSTAFVQGTDFTNNSSVTGSGNFYFSGNTTNQGPFDGSSASSQINFYDATKNTKTNFFDNQNTTPTNTTANKTEPNNSTTFTSCSDVSAPVITAQPQTQIFCSPSTTETKFSVTATSNNTPTYQWYKNEKPISGATASILYLSNITLADTANFYNVVVANSAGSVWSSNVYVKYVIVAQPAPSTSLLATGNAASFAIKTSKVKAWQWQKNGVNISGATTSSYAVPVVNTTDSGSYTVKVVYDGGTCVSDAAVLKTSTILYSKSTGALNVPATWGVANDGSGSSPVDFTRDEHTFIVINRDTASTTADLTIAGKLDLFNTKVTITPGTTLTAGRIVRSNLLRAQAVPGTYTATSTTPDSSSSTPAPSGNTTPTDAPATATLDQAYTASGAFIGSATSNLTITGIATAAYAGASDLYFDASGNILKSLVVTAHTATLRTSLNITATGGTVTINSGTLATSDSLTLKSDAKSTASIAPSAGTITGKVTIEKYIHARRAWRLMSAPVSPENAPSINAAWQEGATSSTDNPNPGFGTHITYGLVSDGFDQNPQKSFSMKVRNASGSWVGVPATKTTTLTDYPAYFIFIRGNRSYDIQGTTAVTTPSSTVLRVTGNVNQGTQATTTVAATGFTLVSNPYACPINFIKFKSDNVMRRIRVWDPTLAGAKGVGGYVILDGNTATGGFRATPPSSNVSTLLQAGQGFFVESNDGVNPGSFTLTEGVKDLSGATLGADRVGAATADTSLEINLKLFNADSTTAIADGVLFNFNAANNDSVDNNDAVKINNFGENIAIKEDSSLLTISNRTMPKQNDSLHLSLTNSKNASYQFEIVPASLSSQAFALYDKYLNSFSPVSSTDTTRITFSVNTAVDASKAADRFTLVVLKSNSKSTVLPVSITSIKAAAKDKAISVEWTVSNESNIAYYEVQKSADGTTFAAAGTVIANASAAYHFTDNKPAAGINYYRVKSVSNNGAAAYTRIVNAQLQTLSATGAASVSVYPNPLTGSAFTLTLSNLAAGAYTLSVVNSNGAAQFSQSIQHNGGTASQKVSLSHSLAAGVYYVKVTAANGTENRVKIIAQ